MASIQISQLAAVTSATDDDVLIINDGDINTRKITYSDLTQNLVSTSGSQVINGDVTINGNLITEGLAVDADLITVDIVNQRIGVGVTDPAHTLDVGGNINIRDGAALRLTDLDSSNAVTLQAPNTLASDTSYTFPNSYPPGPNHLLASNTSGALSWQTALIDPMTTAGDIIYRDATNTTNFLPSGDVAQVLTVQPNGVPAWQNNPSGFADPMTSPGDVIVKNATGVTTRLGMGLAGQSLSVNSSRSALEWAYPTSQAAGSDNQIQFNTGGGLNASADFYYEPSNFRVVAENARVLDGFESLGNTTLGDTGADIVTINGVISSPLIPNGSGGFSVGSQSNRWDVLWMTDTINMTEGGSSFGSINFSQAYGYTFGGQGIGNPSAKLRLNAEDNTNYVSLSAPAASQIGTSYDLVLPGAQGAAGTVLTNDGNGQLSWTTGSGGGGTPTTPGGADTQVQFNSSNTFGGDAGLTFNSTTDLLTVGSQTTISDSNVSIKSGSGNAGSVDLYCEVNNLHYTRLQSGPHASYSGGSVTYTLPTVVPSTNGEVLSSDTSGVMSWSTPTGLSSRTTAVGSTGTIANGASADFTITAAKTYVLQKIETSDAAWVVVYTDAASRSTDSGRSFGTPAADGSGVVSEIVTTGGETKLITPGTLGFNNDGTPSSNVYLKATNLSGAPVDVVVTLTYVSLEN